jgi:hypothetical protein
MLLRSEEGLPESGWQNLKQKLGVVSRIQFNDSMRFFKLNAALLALIFSIVATALFFFVVRAFGRFSEFGTPLNFLAWIAFWFEQLFILPPWWLIFFSIILFARYIFRQNNSRTLRTVIAVLAIGLITLFSLWVHSQLWQNSNWKGEINYLAHVQGAEDAKKDFQAGKLKSFVISGECHEDKFSGTNDGPFQVWIAEYFPQSTYPERYSIEQKIKAYNLVMRSQYKWSLTHTNNATFVK